MYLVYPFNLFIELDPVYINWSILWTVGSSKQASIKAKMNV